MTLNLASTAHLQIASSAPDYNSDFTTAFWYNSNGSTANRYVWSVWNSSTNSEDELRVSNTQALRLYSYDAGATEIGGSTTHATLPAGWNLIIIRRSGLNLGVSLNGGAFVEYANPATLSRLGSDRFTIGTDRVGNTGVGLYWNLVHWSRALSDTEAADFFDEDYASVSATSLYDYWPLTSDALAAENGNDFTAVNSPTYDADPSGQVAWPGVASSTASGTAAIPAMTAAGTAVVSMSASGTSAIPAMTASGSATVAAAIVPAASYFGGEELDGVSGMIAAIEVSRSSGEIPLTVQATAAGTTATGSSNPADELEYTWNFGDPTYPHTGSMVGFNIAPVNYHTPAWTFVDAMKMSKAWAGVSGAVVTVDDEGHLLTITGGGAAAITYIFTVVGSDYPAGVYTCYYEGEATLTWGGDAAVASSSAGYETVTVTPSSGITLTISALNEADPIRNIRLIMPGFTENGKWRNNPFHPTFLERLKHCPVLRFMDWAEVNDSTQTTWASRTTTTFATQDNEYGVALEYQIALANQLKINPWFCVPHLADTDYMTQMATLIRDTLDEDLVAYIEYSNECWNSGFDQSSYCQTAGAIIYPSATFTQQQRRGYSRFAVAMFDIFETVFGGTTRLMRVMADQRGSTSAHRYILDENNAYLKTDVFSVAMYFGSRLANDFTEGEAEALTTTTLMDWADGEVTANIALCENSYDEVSVSPYFLGLIAYEGGSHILGYNDNATVAGIIDVASRSSRMFDAYTDMLQGWAAFGGGIFCAFNDVMDWSNTGRWGHLETQTQARSAAPKYDALLTYAEQQALCFPLMFNPVTGNVLWTNEDQEGVNATHAYRRAGSYTITVTAKNRTTGLVDSTTTTTQEITATNSWTTYYFDPVGGSDANSGLTELLPKQTYGAFETLVENSTASLRILLKRGTTMTTTSVLRFNTSGRRLGAYGTGGVRPKLAGDGIYTGAILTFWANNNTRADWTVSDIEIDCAGVNDFGINSSTNTGSFQHGALIDCYVHDSTGNLINVSGDSQQGWTFYNVEADHGSGDGQTYSLKIHSTVGGTPAKFLTIIGGYMAGGDANPTLHHHVYPSGYRWYDLFSHVDSRAAILKNFVFNTNCQQDGAGIDNEFGLYVNCNITGCSNGIDFGSGGVSPDPLLGMSDKYTIQGCAFHDGGINTQDGGIYGFNLGRLVVRDCTFFAQEQAYIQVTSEVADIRAYRNNFHHASAGSTARIVSVVSGTTSTFFDNTFQVVGGGDRAAVLFVLADVADHTWRGNTYYAPDAIHGGLVKPFKDGSSNFYTFAEWEAFTGDTATVAEPEWFSPGIGDFAVPVVVGPPVAVGSATMPGLTASGTAITANPSAASGTAVVPALAASGAAVVSMTASGTATLPTLTAAGISVNAGATSTGEALMPSLSAFGSATCVAIVPQWRCPMDRRRRIYHGLYLHLRKWL